MMQTHNDLQTLLRLIGCGEKPDLVVHYGSREAGADFDLLAIYPSPPPRSEIIVGNIDLLALDWIAVRSLLGVADPSVTEPILTGNSVYGSGGLLERLRDDAAEIKTDRWEVARHLLQRCWQAHADGVGFLLLEQERRKKPNSVPSTGSLRRSCVSLSFAISYLCFARCYTTGERQILTLRQLVGVVPERLKSIWDATLNLKGQEEISPEQVEKLFQRFETLIIRANYESK